jgi:hypothetical protein
MSGFPEAAIARLAGPQSRRDVYGRAMPLLALHTVDLEDQIGLFGQQGEAIAMAATRALAHPDIDTLTLIQAVIDLRAACSLWAAFEGGAPAEELWPASEPWTADQIDGEVLAPLSTLLYGCEPCRPCMRVGYHVGMIHRREPGELCCFVHVQTTCQGCAKVPCNPPVPATLVVGRRGFCGSCADKGTEQLLRVVA